MQLETKRLFLVPLTAKQIRLWIKDILSLEKDLSCSYQAEPITGELLKFIISQAKKMAIDENNYLYHTFWFLVKKSDRVVIGSADFKNLPDKNGEVEIGYGLAKNFEHNGYMTETVKAMCDWALKQPNISHVIAETEIDNFASENILKRCGFSFYKKNETLWWRL